MPKPMKECLEEAASLIAAKGWGRTQFWKGPGAAEGEENVPVEKRHNFCLLGACVTACPEHERGEFALALGFEEPSELYYWNDREAKNGKQVIARLREAAARLGGEQKEQSNVG